MRAGQGYIYYQRKQGSGSQGDQPAGFQGCLGQLDSIKATENTIFSDEELGQINAILQMK